MSRPLDKVNITEMYRKSPSIRSLNKASKYQYHRSGDDPLI